jgi:hypothetical protein
LNTPSTLAICIKLQFDAIRKRQERPMTIDVTSGAARLAEHALLAARIKAGKREE